MRTFGYFLTSLLLASAQTAVADWPPGGKIVAWPYTASRDIGFTQILETPSGDLMVVTSGEANCCYGWSAQRITRNGDVAAGWPAAGVFLGSLQKSWSGSTQGFAVDDSSGFWRIYVNNTAPFGQFNLQARHVQPNGAAEPTVDPYEWIVRLADVLPVDAAASVGSDVYIAWHDRLMRFTRSGTMASGWPAAGVGVFPPGYSIADPAVLPDGSGGAVVFVRNADVPRAARVDANAAVHPGWPAGGLALGSNVADYDWDRPVRQLVPSGTDHFIAMWLEHPGGDIYGETASVRLQRFGLDGTIDPAWPVGGFQAVAADTLENVTLVADGQGGAHVLWELAGYPRGTHVLSSGAFASDLGPAGVSLLPGSAQYLPLPLHYLVADRAPNGGLVFAWSDAGQSPTTSIRVRWMGPDLSSYPTVPEPGQLIVPTNGMSAACLRAALADGEGGLFLAWGRIDQPGRSLGMTRVLAPPPPPVGVNRPTPNGVTRFTLRAPVPNPASVSVSLYFVLPDDAAASLELLDVSGRLRRSIDVRGTGEHVERFEHLSEMPPGLYFVRLTHRTGEISSRLVLLPQ